MEDTVDNLPVKTISKKKSKPRPLFEFERKAKLHQELFDHYMVLGSLKKVAEVSGTPSFNKIRTIAGKCPSCDCGWHNWSALRKEIKKATAAAAKVRKERENSIALTGEQLKSVKKLIKHQEKTLAKYTKEDLKTLSLGDSLKDIVGEAIDGGRLKIGRVTEAAKVIESVNKVERLITGESTENINHKVSVVENFNNSSKNITNDIEIMKKQLAELMKADDEGDDAIDAEFTEI